MRTQQVVIASLIHKPIAQIQYAHSLSRRRRRFVDGLRQKTTTTTKNDNPTHFERGHTPGNLLIYNVQFLRRCMRWLQQLMMMI